MFGTLQDRLIRELAKAGIAEIDAANRWLRAVYLPAHNARFARPAALPETAFVPADAAALAETLCVQEERVVARDNTVSFGRIKLQLPQSPLRHHFVKARVRVHHYPDGARSPCSTARAASPAMTLRAKRSRRSRGAPA
jgi:hypothetical protein